MGYSQVAQICLSLDVNILSNSTTTLHTISYKADVLCARFSRFQTIAAHFRE